MYPWQKERAKEAIEYWKNQPSDGVATLNSFNGTFQISEMEKIPEPLIPYLMVRFGIEYEGRGFPLKKLEMDAINCALNEVWEGAGSMTKVATVTLELSESQEFFKQK